jgi:hypothetical protein
MPLQQVQESRAIGGFVNRFRSATCVARPYGAEKILLHHVAFCCIEPLSVAQSPYLLPNKCGKVNEKPGDNCRSEFTFSIVR